MGVDGNMGWSWSIFIFRAMEYIRRHDFHLSATIAWYGTAKVLFTPVCWGTRWALFTS